MSWHYLVLGGAAVVVVCSLWCVPSVRSSSWSLSPSLSFWGSVVRGVALMKRREDTYGGKKMQTDSYVESYEDWKSSLSPVFCVTHHPSEKLPEIAYYLSICCVYSGE